MSDTHITKNYFAHGGNELVIGGKLTILENAIVEGLSGGGESYTLPTATDTTLGGIKVGNGLTIVDGVLSAIGVTPAASVSDSEATTIATLKEDFNALLAALRTAGLLETTAPTENEGGGD